MSFVGRIVPIKRADRFLAAAWELRDTPATFMVVGDGEDLAALRGSEIARALGDRLVFTGYRSDIAAVYHASDIVGPDLRQRGHARQPDRGLACGVPSSAPTWAACAAWWTTVSPASSCRRPMRRCSCVASAR